MRLIFLAWLFSVASAQSMLASGFFPLAAGNQWIYRVTGGGPSVAIVEVIGSRTQGSATYFQVRGFLPQDIWLRSGEDGNVFRFDPDARTESLLYAFGLGEGQDYQTSIHACNPSARIDSKPAHYEGPAGVFDNALHILYTNTCNYAGLFDETFVPGIGMIQRGDTAVGQFQYNLIYARVGNRIVTGPEISFGLTLDRTVYSSSATEAPPMLARLSLRIARNEPLQLVFPSGQVYEFLVRNEKGDIVYRWSDGQAFIQIVQQLQFQSGEKNWPIALVLQDAAGRPFPPGRYIAEAWLTTGASKQYSATVGFAIR